jgi:predicted alpha/beta hydrolase family esterase
MTRGIIIHGMPERAGYMSHARPSASNSHWIPWLQRELLIAGHDVQTPEMHNAFAPNYPVWRREFERHVVDEPMILVGHSCGAGFLVRWLSENPTVAVERLALVAPWLDPDRSDTTDFFDFTIDRKLPDRVEAFHIFHSADDMASITTSVAVLLEAFPNAAQHAYSDMGHFCIEDLGTVEFPDLLACLTA